MKPIEHIRAAINLRESGKGTYKARCPSHDDKVESLSVTEKDDGTLLVNCFAGCTTKQIVLDMGLAMSDLFPERYRQTPNNGKIVAKYDYYDKDGAIVYQACRMEPKDFRQRRPDGKGGWIWNMKGVTRVIYNLPQVLKSKNDEWVFIVEGEKDAENVKKLGLIATCIAGGAKADWLKTFSNHLKGRNVCILPDNDNPGREFATKVAKSVVHKDSVCKVVALPDLEEKEDVSDWIEAGGTKQQLLDLALRADVWKKTEDQAGLDPDSTAENTTDAAKKVMEKIQIRVIGETPTGQIRVYSEYHRKSASIQNADRLGLAQLAQIGGPPVTGEVYTGDDGDGTKLTNVRLAIALLAGHVKFRPENEIGRGIWSGLDEYGLPTNDIILVNAGEGAKYDGSSITRVLDPSESGRFINFNGGDNWYNYERLADYIKQAKNPEWRREIIGSCESLFEQWRWTHQEMAPAILSGLILATWVQTIWDWRPQVSVSGKSDSGKTTLFDTVSTMFASLGMKSSQSSAAGIRQQLATSASLLFCDEFESGKHRKDILEMLRGSGRGDATFRGTTGGQQGIKFQLQHIVWTAGIETGLNEEADRNRFICLQLIRPPNKEMGQLQIPPDESLLDLGQRLLASAIVTMNQAKETIRYLKDNAPRSYNNRVIESYCVPIAAYAAAAGYSNEDALERLTFALESITWETSDDEADLLDDILGSTVDIGHGQRPSVSQALAETKCLAASEGLEKVGVKVVHEEATSGKGKQKFLFIVCKPVLRYLLKGTRWEHKNIDEILERVEGAFKTRRRLARRRAYGVAVPMRVAIPEEEDAEYLFDD